VTTKSDARSGIWTEIQRARKYRQTVVRIDLHPETWKAILRSMENGGDVDALVRRELLFGFPVRQFEGVSDYAVVTVDG